MAGERTRQGRAIRDARLCAAQAVFSRALGLARNYLPDRTLGSRVSTLRETPPRGRSRAPRRSCRLLVTLAAALQEHAKAG